MSDVGTIMVVDDHLVLAELLAGSMTAAGFDVAVVAANREQVLAAAEGRSFTLAVLDVSFTDGGEEGVELIAPLRATGARVVMLTGNGDPLVHARCLREGATGVITKSQPFASLVEALERAATDRPVHGVTAERELLHRLELHEAERTRRLAPFSLLTPKEEAILQGLSEGYNATELAERNFVSLATVRAQVRSILFKLDAHSQLAAVAAARDAGWTPRHSSTSPSPTTRSATKVPSGSNR